MRFGDILPPPAVRTAMELQAEAERKKRAQILESEGSRENQINKASGEAEAIYKKAEATARGIRILADSIKKDRGADAVGLRIAEQYVDAFRQIAKESTTVLMNSSSLNDPASMVAQALSIYQKIGGGQSDQAGSSRVKDSPGAKQEAVNLDVENAKATQNNSRMFSLSKRS
jgi:regulator of protease activity HflC (stomatin/prohibitin superfamily)